MMSTKPKQDVRVPVLKGQEAEDKVLEYLKQMNRPFGAVDVAANLKGAVPKTAVQKFMVTLAEKGELKQKNYGKTSFFVYNQSKIDSLPNDKVNEFKHELTKLEEENKFLAGEVKFYTTELAKVNATLTDDEVEAQIVTLRASIEQVTKNLQPLRSGAPPISAEELAHLYADWTKWRAEWVRRRKIFNTFWNLAVDALPPPEAKDLEELLGIERDTPEHTALEQGDFCQQVSNPLKRKRP